MCMVQVVHGPCAQVTSHACSTPQLHSRHRCRVMASSRLQARRSCSRAAAWSQPHLSTCTVRCQPAHAAPLSHIHWLAAYAPRACPALTTSPGSCSPGYHHPGQPEPRDPICLTQRPPSAHLSIRHERASECRKTTPFNNRACVVHTAAPLTRPTAPQAAP